MSPAEIFKKLTNSLLLDPCGVTWATLVLLNEFGDALNIPRVNPPGQLHQKDGRYFCIIVVEDPKIS